MREKWDGEHLAAETPASEDRIRRDLERLGVTPEFSGPVAARLGALADDLTAEEYAAVLSGVATAYGVHRETPPVASGESGSGELQRLTDDFASELRKLDEGLRILSAYLVRMRTRSTPPARVLH